MKLYQRFSLQQLVAGSLTGALLCYACNWLQLFPWQSMWSRLPIAVLFFIGFLATILMPSALEKGIANELWSAEAIEKLRQTLQQTRWTITSWSLILLPLLYFLFFDTPTEHGHHNRSVANLAFFYAYPWMVRSSLIRGLRPRPQKQRTINWKTEMKPVVSEHWGQRS